MRTCSTYGLSIDADLTEKMACEAESIAIASPPISGRGSDDHVARASVMPQVKIALQRVLTEWVETHPWSDRGTHSDTRLDASRYDTFARIDEAVDALGETAWRAFQSALAESEGVDLRGIFERDEIYDAQSRSFSRLMNGLVDYRSRECVELTYLDSDDPPCVPTCFS